MSTPRKDQLMALRLADKMLSLAKVRAMERLTHYRGQSGRLITDKRPTKAP